MVISWAQSGEAVGSLMRTDATDTSAAVVVGAAS